MRKYSNIEITDDNFDEEYEKLAELFDIRGTFNSFVSELPFSFVKQDNNGVEEWLSSSNLKNNFSSSINQCIHSCCMLAYEFKNGFLIIDFEEVL